MQAHEAEQKLWSHISVSEGDGDVEAAPARPDGYQPLNTGEVSILVLSPCKGFGF